MHGAIELALVIMSGCGSRASALARLGQLRLARLGRLAQDAEARSPDPAQASSPSTRDQLVLGEAEEGEVVVVHPLEQRGGLLALVAVQRRRRVTQLGDEVVGAAAHRRPVSTAAAPGA